MSEALNFELIKQINELILENEKLRNMIYNHPPTISIPKCKYCKSVWNEEGGYFDHSENCTFNRDYIEYHGFTNNSK